MQKRKLYLNNIESKYSLFRHFVFFISKVLIFSFFVYVGYAEGKSTTDYLSEIPGVYECADDCMGDFPWTIFIFGSFVSLVKISPHSITSVFGIWFNLITFGISILNIIVKCRDGGWICHAYMSRGLTFIELIGILKMLALILNRKSPPVGQSADNQFHFLEILSIELAMLLVIVLFLNKILTFITYGLIYGFIIGMITVVCFFAVSICYYCSERFLTGDSGLWLIISEDFLNIWQHLNYFYFDWMFLKGEDTRIEFGRVKELIYDMIVHPFEKGFLLLINFVGFSCLIVIVEFVITFSNFTSAWYLACEKIIKESNVADDVESVVDIKRALWRHLFRRGGDCGSYTNISDPLLNILAFIAQLI